MAKLLLLVCCTGFLLLIVTSASARVASKHGSTPTRSHSREDPDCDDRRMKDKPQCNKPSSAPTKSFKVRKFPKQWENHARRLLSPYGQHNRVLVSLPFPDERTPPKKEREEEIEEKPTESPCKSKPKTPCEEKEKSREKPCSKIPKIKSALKVVEGMRQLLSME